MLSEINKTILNYTGMKYRFKMFWIKYIYRIIIFPMVNWIFHIEINSLKVLKRDGFKLCNHFRNFDDWNGLEMI